MVVAVALVDPQDQPLPDIAREVQVDIRHGLKLLVEEAAVEQPVLDRIDVRQPHQVADDRADRRAAPAPGWQAGAPADGARPAHLAGHLRGQLLQVAVDEEEAGELMLGDERQLLLQLPAGALHPLWRGRLGRVPLGEARPAIGREHFVGGGLLLRGPLAREIGEGVP